jgi:hypothetical protein
MRAIIATVMMSGIDFSDMAFLQCLGTEAQPALMAAYIEASNLEGRCHADVEDVRNIHAETGKATHRKSFLVLSDRGIFLFHSTLNLGFFRRCSRLRNS